MSFLLRAFPTPRTESDEAQALTMLNLHKDVEDKEAAASFEDSEAVRAKVRAAKSALDAYSKSRLSIPIFDIFARYHDAILGKQPLVSQLSLDQYLQFATLEGVYHFQPADGAQTQHEGEATAETRSAQTTTNIRHTFATPNATLADLYTAMSDVRETMRCHTKPDAPPLNITQSHFPELTKAWVGVRNAASSAPGGVESTGADQPTLDALGRFDETFRGLIKSKGTTRSAAGRHDEARTGGGA